MSCQKCRGRALRGPSCARRPTRKISQIPRRNACTIAARDGERTSGRTHRCRIVPARTRRATMALAIDEPRAGPARRRNGA
jgi:hypothetical protein